MLVRLILATVLSAQAILRSFAGVIPLSIEWERYYSYGFVFRAASSVRAGGYLLGADASAGAGDYGIVRISSAGEKMWQANFGGSDWDRLFAVAETSRGGFLLGGQTVSLPGPGKDAPRINSHSMADAWVVRVDQEGRKLWDRAYGSAVYGVVKSIAALEDGSVILGGDSSSDFWFQKIDANGDPLWAATFGGDGLEMLQTITLVTNNQLFAVGMSESGTSTNKTAVAYGQADGWLVHLDSAGRNLWDRAFGGSDDDYLFAVEALASNGCIIAGASESPVSGNKESPAFGRHDAWIIRVSSSGDKLWERTFGGQGADEIYSIAVLPDGGFLLSGASNSSELTKMGVARWAPWVLRLDPDGNLLWDIRLRRTGFEFPSNRLFLEPSGSFLLAGYSDGLWAVRFAPETILQKEGFLWAKPPYIYPRDPLGTFHLSAPIGSRWDIERSADLLNWSKAADVLLTESAASFTDPAPVGEKTFFRAKAR